MAIETVDPYKTGLIKENVYERAKRRTVKGNVVVVLDIKLDGRRLQLIPMTGRAILSGEIHELLLTDEENAGPGAEVNSVGVVGFMEFTHGGIIAAGDKVTIGSRVIGAIAGFDETHYPNHLNIVMRTSRRMTGFDLMIEVEDPVTIFR